MPMASNINSAYPHHLSDPYGVEHREGNHFLQIFDASGIGTFL